MRSETRPEHAALDAREGSGIGRSLEANQQRFMTSVAHELRTPITTIVGAAELLLTGGDENPMLTACDDEMSVVVGLEVGADDYIGLGRSDLLVIASDGCQPAVRTPNSESCSIYRERRAERTFRGRECKIGSRVPSAGGSHPRCGIGTGIF